MKTRERILTAAMDLARTGGFYKVAVDDLARQAAVSKRTIYRHFRSKDEIVEAVMTLHMERVAREVQDLVAGEKSPDRIMSGLVALFPKYVQAVANPVLLDDLRRYYPWMWKKIDRFRAEKVQHIISVLREKSDRGNILKVDPRITTAAVMASIQAVVNPDFVLDNGFTFDEAAGQLISIFRFGLFREEDRS